MKPRERVGPETDPPAGAEGPVFPAGVGIAPPEPGAFSRPPFPRPILLVALSYLGGLSAGRLLLLPPLLPAMAASLLAIFSASILIRNRAPVFLAPSSGMPLLVALGLLGWGASNGAMREEWAAAAETRRFEQAEFVRVQGEATSVVRLEERGLRLRLKDAVVRAPGVEGDRNPFPMDIELVYFGVEAARNFPDQESELIRALRELPGARIAVWARPSIPQGASHPWDFDEVAYQRHRGVGAGFHLPSLLLVEVLEPASTIQQFSNRMLTSGHEAVRDALRRRVSPEASAIAQAMVLGERSVISDETRAAFRDSGLAHILVVSGLHTAFILGLALSLARLSGLPPRLWPLVGLVALGLFAAWVGFRPPVVRASIMGTFLVGAWWLGRSASTLAGLAAAAFVTLLFDPRNLLRPDWQLSYGCVLSLTLLMPPLVELAKTALSDEAEVGEPAGPMQRLQHVLRSALLFPAAAVLSILMGLLPFQAHYFGQVNLGTIASNLIAIPLAYATMLSTLAYAVLHEVPGIREMAGVAIDGSAGGLAGCARFFEGIEIGRAQLTQLHPALILVYSLFLVAGPHLRRNGNAFGIMTRRQLRHLAVRVGAFFMIVAWAPVAARAAIPANLEIYVLDVGQGDALVLRAPNGAVGVVDGGGGRGGGEGEKTIVPFLKGLGVTRLAFVAATHTDADHVGGLDAVIEAFEVPLLLVGPHKAETGAWRELMSAVAAHRVRVQEIRAGDSLGGFGGTAVHFLGPQPGQTGNDASIVMLLDYGDVEILLTGDIEREAEYRLLETNEAIDIDVLKVAHHGSRTSTSEAFLRVFRPEVALISAGRNNRFGHPAPEVIDRLERMGIFVARTDLHGSLRITTDGKRIRIERFGPRLPRDPSSKTL